MNLDYFIIQIHSSISVILFPPAFFPLYHLIVKRIFCIDLDSGSVESIRNEGLIQTNPSKDVWRLHVVDGHHHHHVHFSKSQNFWFIVPQYTPTKKSHEI
jgi:hypothetical protein